MKTHYKQGFARKSFRYREKNDYTEHRLILDIYFDEEGDLMIDLKSRYRDGMGRKITRLNDVLVTVPRQVMENKTVQYHQTMHWQHMEGTSDRIKTGEVQIKGGEENQIKIVHCGEFERKER